MLLKYLAALPNNIFPNYYFIAVVESIFLKKNRYGDLKRGKCFLHVVSLHKNMNYYSILLNLRKHFITDSSSILLKNNNFFFLSFSILRF